MLWSGIWDLWSGVWGLLAGVGIGMIKGLFLGRRYLSNCISCLCTTTIFRERMCFL